MSIINSNTTGHSRTKEISFSKKLFIGLGLAVVAAMVFFLFVGGSNEVAKTAVPTPISEQPKN